MHALNLRTLLQNNKMIDDQIMTFGLSNAKEWTELYKISL